MFITSLFGLRKKCNHDKITPDMEGGYCPDCGKLIQNEWYITRCSCCGVKLKSAIRSGEVVPQYNYCSNCGSEEYSVEKLQKINFIDINYAVLRKREVEENVLKPFTTQCWEEKTYVKPKLLAQFL